MTEVLMVLATTQINAERTDGSISPTICARAGTGGGQLPILILRTDDKGSDNVVLSEDNRANNGKQSSR